MRICSVEHCERKHSCHGWCDMHYKRWQRFGDPTYTKTRPHGLNAQQVIEHVQGCSAPGTHDCWEWQGERDEHGYGRISFGGRGVRASRLSFIVWNGPLEDDQVVRHSCDNPPCVNPRHLVAGTTQNNVADRQERQRQARGETQHLAVLTLEKVREMRSRAAQGECQSHLAQEFGVSQSTAHSAITGKTWAHA